jgi:hypothetical protein
VQGYCVLAGPLADADPTQPDADPTQPDADPTQPDAFSGPDATPTTASARLVGSASCTAPTSIITVPAAGLDVGSVALVHAYRRSSTGDVTSVIDSRGNSYSELHIAGGEGTSATLWQGTITTALLAGDTITVSEPNGNSAIIVSELRGVNPSPVSLQGATADDGAISVGFTSMSPGLVLCSGGNRGGNVQLDSNWTSIDNLSASCGGGQGDLTVFAYWLTAGTNGITSCEGSFTLVNGFEQWVGIVASFVDQ